MSEGALKSRALLVGVGGTARAALKLARHYYGISDDCCSITAEQLVVSKYGVREGYLCQKILKDHTDTPKTGS